MQATGWQNARKLLIARLDNAGDVLLTGPALRAVRNQLPECHLTLWSSPGGAAVAGLLPEIDDTLTTRALWQDLGHLPFDPRREQNLLETLSRGHYDGAIIFTSFAQSPHPAAYACYLAGIPRRAGQSKEFAGGVLTHPVTPLPDDVHQVDRNLHLVRSLGWNAVSHELAVSISDQDRDTLGLLLRIKGIGLGRPFALIHPGASCPSRRYPLARFAEVGRSLHRGLGWSIVISGGEREVERAKDLAVAIGPGAVSLAGETRVGEFAALVERATVVITNNTFTMHLADAARTPEVVLFAGTEHESQWRPRTTRSRVLRQPTPCQPCYRFECPFGLPCLDIPPRQVAAAVLELVGETAQ